MMFMEALNMEITIGFALINLRQTSFSAELFDS